MPDTPVQFTGSILERLETTVTEKAPHLLPVVHAIRDHGVGFLVIPQRATGLDRGPAVADIDGDIVASRDAPAEALAQRGVIGQVWQDQDGCPVGGAAR